MDIPQKGFFWDITFAGFCGAGFCGRCAGKSRRGKMRRYRSQAVVARALTNLRGFCAFWSWECHASDLRLLYGHPRNMMA